MDEIWRSIPSFPGYEVSNQGRVKNAIRGKILKMAATTGGYPTVGPVCNGAKKTSTVHRLVMEAFVGPRPTDRWHIAHTDGNPKNNNLCNLRYATPAENAQDFKRLGKSLKYKGGAPIMGDDHASSKLRSHQIPRIRASRAMGYSCASLAIIYKVSESAIRDVCIGKTWGHIKPGKGPDT